MKNILEIKQLLVAMSAYFQKPLTDMVIDMYAKDLSDLSTESLQLAFAKMRRDPKVCTMFMPLYPAIIREYVGGDNSGNLIAGEIISCMTQFGRYQAVEAREFLGEEKWEIVNRYGGWNALCGLTNDQMGIARAQLRDLAKSMGKISNAPKLAIAGQEQKAIGVSA